MGKDPQPFAGHTAEITSIEYSHDGRILATASLDKTVRFWCPKTGKLIRQIAGDSPFRSLSFSRSGRLAAISAEQRAPASQVYVWDVGVEAGGSVPPVETVYEADGQEGSGSHLVHFSSNEKLIAVMTPSRVVLQDAMSGKLLVDVVKPGSGLRFDSALSFSCSDQKLLFACHDSDPRSLPKFRIFDLGSKRHSELTLSLNPSVKLKSVFAFSPDGNTVAAAVTGGGFQTWNTETGVALQGPLLGHVEETKSISFSPDGLWVIDCSSLNTICAWDASTGELALGPLQSYHFTKAVTCSPNKEHIACVGSGGTVHVWDVPWRKVYLSSVLDPESENPPILRHHGRGVDAIHWFPDGRRFVTSNGDNYIRTWDAQTGEQVNKFLFAGGSRVALSADGELLAVGSTRRLGVVILLDARTGQEHPPFLVRIGATRKLEFAPDKSVLAVIPLSGQSLLGGLHIVRDLLGHRKIEVVENSREVIDVSFSPDSQRFAYVNEGEDGIIVRETATLEITRKLASEASRVGDRLSFSPDGGRLLDRHNNNAILWDLTNRQQVHIFSQPGTTPTVRALFSPDGRLFVCFRAGDGYSIETAVMDADSRDVISSWRLALTPEQDVSAMALAPGGERITIGFWDASMKVLEAATGDIIVPKESSRSEEDLVVELEKRDQRTRLGPSRQTGGLTNFDDDSILNMPATLMGRSGLDRGVPTRATRKETQRTAEQNSERPGLAARLVSRLRLGLYKPRGSGERRDHPLRSFRLVSIAKDKPRVMAADDRPNRRNAPREEVADDSSSSPSPSRSAHAQAGIDESRSSTPSDHGLVDTIRYCLCIPRCR